YPLAFRQSRQAVAQLVSLVRFDVEVRESVILMQERRVLHKDVVDGYRVPGRPLPEDLQAVVDTHAVKPARKVTHLLEGKLALQLLVNIHDRVLRGLRLAEVLEADPVDKFHVPEEEMPEGIAIPGPAKQVQQLVIGLLVVCQPVGGANRQGRGQGGGTLLRSSCQSGQTYGRIRRWPRRCRGIRTGSRDTRGWNRARKRAASPGGRAR